jgi:hypothetical protein
MAWQDNRGNKGTDDNVRLVAEAPYHPGYEDAVVHNGASVSAPVNFQSATGSSSPLFGGAGVTEVGRKFDGGKLEYGLLPPYALEEVVKVLTFGAQKYERDNWQKVPDSKRRYYDALQRHVWAWKRGEKFDPESGIHHLAHAMCCLMFLYEHDTIYSLHNEETQ